jgi:hypothetical protein
MCNVSIPAGQRRGPVGMRETALDHAFSVSRGHGFESLRRQPAKSAPPAGREQYVDKGQLSRCTGSWILTHG